MSVEISSCPKKQFYVRKRKDGKDTFLIYLTKIYKIDKTSECIWDACTGSNSIFEISNDVHSKFGIDLNEAIQLVVSNVMFFNEKKLVAV